MNDNHIAPYTLRVLQRRLQNKHIWTVTMKKMQKKIVISSIFNILVQWCLNLVLQKLYFEQFYFGELGYILRTSDLKTVRISGAWKNIPFTLLFPRVYGNITIFSSRNFYQDCHSEQYYLHRCAVLIICQRVNKLCTPRAAGGIGLS